jgi:hypothetical protein
VRTGFDHLGDDDVRDVRRRVRHRLNLDAGLGQEVAQGRERRHFDEVSEPVEAYLHVLTLRLRITIGRSP